MTKKKTDALKESPQITSPLAIVGIGCLFPKAGNVNEYWANIREGVDAITDIPDSHWNPEDYFDPDQKTPDMTYARRGGFIDPVDFNPLQYGMSPNNIEATDTTQLLGMVVARQALLDAGYSTGKGFGDGKEFDRDRTSVIMGVTGTLELVIPLGARLGHPIWRQALADAGVDPETTEDVVQRISDSYVPWQENSFPGLLGNVAAGRIANRFDLGGTNCVVDAACASSLSAIHLASLELATGRSDMAIAGGLDTFNDIFMYMCFSKTPALSPTGNSRPFALGGDGTIIGEGMGAVILKRLDDAQRDGDQIYAVIKGIGTSSDGRGNAIYAPNVAGQTKALEDAYVQANVTPDSIELVEAHGTGTSVGDAVEAEALENVYRQANQDDTWCALGSVKSMIGHTKSAAGVAGLIKTVMALKHKVLPPTIKVDQPLESLEPGRAPMYVNTIKRPWVANDSHPRRAALSAFGFGGSNFHCVLEEVENYAAEIDWDGRVLLFALSADSKEELRKQLSAIDTNYSWSEHRALAARSRTDFDANKPHRLAFVVEQEKTDLQTLIQQAIKMLSEDVDHDFWQLPLGVSYASDIHENKTGLLFPGQGSQYVGMLRDLACQFPQFNIILSEANAAKGETRHGSRLTDAIYPVPVFSDEARQDQENILRDTHNAQAAIGAVSLSGLRTLEQFGFKADVTAGHSYGELVALCAAGIFDESALHQLSLLRGKLMATGEGDRGLMLAVSATFEDVEKLIKDEKLDLIIANHNAPTQIVLSGATDQIEKAAALCKQQKLRATQLPVSAAFHSKFVADAEAPFADALTKIELHENKMTVLANTTADEYPSNKDDIRRLLAGQLASPVRFVKQIEKMLALGVRTFVEVGPGNRLSSLVKAILGDKQDDLEFQVLTLDASSGKRHGQYDLANLLASLAVLDKGIDLSLWDASYLDSLDETSEKKPAMTISLSGANYIMPREKRPARPQQAKQVAQQEKPQKTEFKNPVLSKPSSDRSSLDRPSLTGPSPDQQITSPQQGLSALRTTQESILALQKMQEQTAKLHQQYLQGQETTQQTIAQLLLQQQALLGLEVTTTPVPAPTVQAKNVAPVQLAPEVPVAIPHPVEQAKPAIEIIETENAVHADEEVHSILLDVVAEKTGYPLEMLSLDMSLDTDLGIDSIKRVEILSALQERLPGAPTVNPEELGTFQLLENIVEFLVAAMPRMTAATPQATAQDVPDVSNNTLQEVLLDVVAEKTGYPLEMLSLEMSLDTDLGIDSIKRVEILSALQEQMPDAPMVSPEDLGKLQTLQQIVEHMLASSPAATTHKPAPPEAVVVGDTASIERQVLTAVPLTTEQENISLKKNSTVWVTGEAPEFTQAICEALKQHDLKPEIVTLDALPDSNIAGLIILTPANPDQTFLKDSFMLVQRVGASLHAAGQSNAAILVSVTQMGGQFGLNGVGNTCPVSGGIAGLIKTADKEWPEVSCKAIDVQYKDNVTELANNIIDECLTRDLLGGTLEVGIANEQRYTLKLNTAAINGNKTSRTLNSNDVVVVTGGARGVTAEIAVALAERYQTNLLLLGRSQMPEPEEAWLNGLTSEAEIKKAVLKHNEKGLKLKLIKPKDIDNSCKKIIADREIRNNLQRIKATGVKVMYRAVDVRIKNEVVAAVDEARESLGNISGFVHGAGVLADKLIEDKTEEQFSNVYATKVTGIDSLLTATENDPLKIMVMFSSSTGRFGRKGQCDYAAANEVLNKIAQQQARLRTDCRVVSVNWGPWDGGMVTPALKKIFARESVGVIDLKAGADYLMQEIAHEGPVEVVVLGFTEQLGSSDHKQTGAAITEQSSNTESTGTETSLEEIPAVNMNVAFSRSLNVNDHVFLQSHVINGHAVLPVAMMTEWFAHGAMHDNPGLNYQGFRNLHVFNGVTLKADDTIDLDILAGDINKDGDKDIIPVELRSGKILHARAEVILAAIKIQPQECRNQTVSGEYSQSNNEIYISGRLFHGRTLQGITDIEACEVTGISANVKSATAPKSWMKKPIRSSWLADPLALDSSFQMMILWCFEQFGIGSLPTAIGEYRQFQKFFPKEGCKININVIEHSEHRALARIEFIDQNEQLIARIDNYECVIDASLEEAFGKNKLQIPSIN